jgi:hypothetical protein
MGLWSRRSRVRVPSLTFTKTCKIAGSGTVWPADHRTMDPIWVQFLGVKVLEPAPTVVLAVGLITRRSRVRIPPPLLHETPAKFGASSSGLGPTQAGGDPSGNRVASPSPRRPVCIGRIHDFGDALSDHVGIRFKVGRPIPGREAGRPLAHGLRDGAQ